MTGKTMLLTKEERAEYEALHPSPTYYVGGRRTGKTTWIMNWVKDIPTSPHVYDIRPPRFVVVHSAATAAMWIKEYELAAAQIITPNTLMVFEHFRGQKRPAEYMVDEIDYFDMRALMNHLQPHKFMGGTLTGNVVLPDEDYDGRI